MSDDLIHGDWGTVYPWRDRPLHLSVDGRAICSGGNRLSIKRHGTGQPDVTTVCARCLAAWRRQTK